MRWDSRDCRDGKILLIFLALGVLIFARGLSWHGVEYRDDEIFYLRSTQEMMETGNYLSPTYFGENRFQKPILYYWLIIFSYKILGISWFSARLVSVLFAGLTVGITWLLARDWFSRRVADLSAIVLLTMPLFFRHAKNAVPDMALNFFIVLAIGSGLRFLQNPKVQGYRHMFFLACALGFMIKGFAALAIPFFTIGIFAVTLRETDKFRSFRFLPGLLMIGCIVLPWFLYMGWRHGEVYLRHMLVQETQNRLIATGEDHLLLRILTSLSRNMMFYLQVMLKYFAPWSLFLVGALPWALWRLRPAGETRRSLTAPLIWCGIVFLFFSFVHVTISHYLLVLSTPLAILISHFLRESTTFPLSFQRWIQVFFCLLLIAMTLVWSFLHVYLAGAPFAWIGVYLGLGMAALWMILGKHRSAAPLIVGCLLLAAFAQPEIIQQAGVTAHSTLGRIAQTINRQKGPDAVIGVGSHDIHEKEFQVFFTQPVEKAATGYEPFTQANMKELLGLSQEVFCLVVEPDYQKFLEDFRGNRFDIIHEDYIFRKRLYLDGGFVNALLHLDRERIHAYLKEKVILLHKDAVSVPALPSQVTHEKAAAI
jgi:4-amino-4-deoxy-L-arabinose transferase-like glycosyltransferase